MKFNGCLVAVAVLLLAACAPPSGGEPEPLLDDVASGSPAERDEDVVLTTNEPFWQARLEGDVLILEGPGQAPRRFTGARDAMTADGRRIEARDATGDVVLIVRRMRCEDDMSGARFPMTGLLSVDGAPPVRGCARPASMPPPGEPTVADAISSPWTGRWDADADVCADVEAGDVRLEIGPHALRFHESTATPERVSRVDEETLELALAFDGEGQQWSETRRLRLEDDGRTLVVEGPGTPRMSRVRCPGATGAGSASVDAG